MTAVAQEKKRKGGGGEQGGKKKKKAKKDANAPKGTQSAYLIWCVGLPACPPARLPACPPAAEPPRPCRRLPCVALGEACRCALTSYVAGNLTHVGVPRSIAEREKIKEQQPDLKPPEIMKKMGCARLSAALCRALCLAVSSRQLVRVGRAHSVCVSGRVCRHTGAGRMGARSRCLVLAR